MYKRNDGSTGFSWMRLVTNAFPNFAYNSSNDVDLSPEAADSVFRYQLDQPNPRALGPMSFYYGEVIGDQEQKTYSPRIFKALHKNGVLTEDDATLNTAAITKHFANQVAFIDVHRQRKLVGLLFMWEEELVRWRLLDDEEKEIRHVMEQVGKDSEVLSDLKVRLQQVEMKRKLVPSMRHNESVPAEGVHAHPPAYKDATA